jgi:hypothetical protein
LADFAWDRVRTGNVHIKQDFTVVAYFHYDCGGLVSRRVCDVLCFQLVNPVMAARIELVAGWNLRNCVDSSHLRELKPPFQSCVTFLELHYTTCSLVVTRQVEGWWVLRIVMQEDRVFPL